MSDVAPETPEVQPEKPKKAKHAGLFKKKDPNSGEIDPRQWRGGRAYYNYNREPETYREMGKQELFALLRKLKPHTKEAINVTVAIMQKKNISEATQLKAAAFLYSEYKNLVKEIYDTDDEVNPEDDKSNLNQEPAQLFSLKVVAGKEAEREAQDEDQDVKGQE